MHLNGYQLEAVKTAQYPNKGNNFVYPALGLAGEAGEVAEKIKKIWRNRGVMSGDLVTDEERQEIIKEMGDCLWYLAALCEEIDATMNEVAETNLEKLRDRRERGVIKSAGDNR